MKPSIEQLKTVIANGTDDVLNCLVLRTDGQFELRDITGQMPALLQFPDVVGRYETLAPGNGYVGPEAANDEHFIRNAFNDLMKCWEVYQVNGRMNMHTW